MFYNGWIADRIAEDMKANGGIITKDDLARYKAKERVPVRGTYKGYDIVSMPPPSSGGVVLLEMLNILEPLRSQGQGLLTAPALHLQIEAMRRAYLDRARHLGDPDFVDVPVARLTSKNYARTVAASIDADKASSSVELGKDIVTVPAAESRRNDALLRARPQRPRRHEHLHARRQLRLTRRRQGDGLPPQQRDGRLQQEAGRDEPDRRHRHASEPHRTAAKQC